MCTFFEIAQKTGRFWLQKGQEKLRKRRISTVKQAILHSKTIENGCRSPALPASARR
jgi:hypothetical protein